MSQPSPLWWWDTRDSPARNRRVPLHPAALLSERGLNRKTRQHIRGHGNAARSRRGLAYAGPLTIARACSLHRGAEERWTVERPTVRLNTVGALRRPTSAYEF
jgi:hypothetical protein